MANAYTQLYVHIVFSVKRRTNKVSPQWKDRLYKYISGIIKHRKQKLMVIGSMSDHIHLLLGFNPARTLSNLVRDIKSSSSKWINEERLSM